MRFVLENCLYNCSVLNLTTCSPVYYRLYKMRVVLENCLSNCSVLNLTTGSPVYPDVEEFTQEEVRKHFYPSVSQTYYEFTLKDLSCKQFGPVLLKL